MYGIYRTIKAQPIIFENELWATGMKAAFLLVHHIFCIPYTRLPPKNFTTQYENESTGESYIFASACSQLLSFV